MSQTEEKYFTMVFEVTDKEAFATFSQRFTRSMMGVGSGLPGAIVTGCGWCDSMTEADAYQQRLEEENINPEGVLEEFYGSLDNPEEDED